MEQRFRRAHHNHRMSKNYEQLAKTCGAFGLFLR
jgi:hypothetical protein